MYNLVKVGIASNILPYYGQVDQCEAFMNSFWRLSRRTWNDYEKGLITQIKGKLRKLYDFNASEEMDNFNLSIYRYDIQLSIPKNWNAFYKLLLTVLQEHEEKEYSNKRPLKMYWIAPIELNGLSKEKCQEIREILFTKFRVSASYLKKLNFPYHFKFIRSSFEDWLQTTFQVHRRSCTQKRIQPHEKGSETRLS